MFRDATELDKAVAADVSQVVDAFTRLRRENELLVAAVARQHGLNSPDFRALAFLRQTPDGTPGSLADYLSHSLSATTAMIDRLVAAGYVRRVPNPEDGRSVYLEPTPEGAEVVDRATAIYSAAFERAVPARRRDLVSEAFEHLADALADIARRTDQL